MTNKEWLNSLSSEDFAEWCCGLDAIDYNTGKPIGIYPHLETIKRSYTSSQGGLEEWLDEKTLYRGPEELNFDEESEHLNNLFYYIRGDSDITEDDLAEYLESISGAKNFWEFLEQAFNKLLDDDDKFKLFDSMRISDIDMFTSTSKKFILELMHSSDKWISNTAKDMYSVYKSRFDEIESKEELENE